MFREVMSSPPRKSKNICPSVGDKGLDPGLSNGRLQALPVFIHDFLLSVSLTGPGGNLTNVQTELVTHSTPIGRTGHQSLGPCPHCDMYYPVPGQQVGALLPGPAAPNPLLKE